MTIHFIDAALPPEYYKKMVKEQERKEKALKKIERKEQKRKEKEAKKLEKQKKKMEKLKAKQGLTGLRQEDNNVNLSSQASNTQEIALNAAAWPGTSAEESTPVGSIIIILAAFLLCVTSAIVYRKKQSK